MGKCLDLYYLGLNGVFLTSNVMYVYLEISFFLFT